MGRRLVRKGQKAVLKTFAFDLLCRFSYGPGGLGVATRLIVSDPNGYVQSKFFCSQDAVLSVIQKRDVSACIPVDLDHVMRIVVRIQCVFQRRAFRADLFKVLAAGQHRLHFRQSLCLIQIKILVCTVISPELFFTGTPVPEMRGRKPSGCGHVNVRSRDRCRAVSNFISGRIIVQGVCLRICAALKDPVVGRQIIDPGKTGPVLLYMIKIPANIRIARLGINKIGLSAALFRHKIVAIEPAAIGSGPADIYCHTGTIAIGCHCFFNCFTAAAGSFVDDGVFPNGKRVIGKAVLTFSVWQRTDIIAASPQLVGGNAACAVSRP